MASVGQPGTRRLGSDLANRDSKAKAKAISAPLVALPPALTKGIGAAGIAALLAILVANVAPGGFQPRRNITGTVQLNDKPLADAVLEFHADGDGRAPIVLSTSDVGSFQRSGQAGLPEGSYAVVVKSGCILPNPSAERGRPVRIPDRYMSAASTPLRVKVAADDVSVRLVLSR